MSVIDEPMPQKVSPTPLSPETTAILRKIKETFFPSAFPSCIYELDIGDVHLRLRRTSVAGLLARILPGIASDASLDDVKAWVFHHGKGGVYLACVRSDGWRSDSLQLWEDLEKHPLDSISCSDHLKSNEYRMSGLLPLKRLDLPPTSCLELLRVAVEDDDFPSFQIILEKIYTWQSKEFIKTRCRLDASSVLAAVPNSWDHDKWKRMMSYLTDYVYFDAAASLTPLQTDSFGRALKGIVCGASHGFDFYEVVELLLSRKDGPNVLTDVLFATTMNRFFERPLEDFEMNEYFGILNNERDKNSIYFYPLMAIASGAALLRLFIEKAEPEALGEVFDRIMTNGANIRSYYKVDAMFEQFQVSMKLGRWLRGTKFTPDDFLDFDEFDEFKCRVAAVRHRIHIRQRKEEAFDVLLENSDVFAPDKYIPRHGAAELDAMFE